MRIVLILSALLAACATTPKSLPHRQTWELYAQGNSPDVNHCTGGTAPFYIIEDNRQFFLMCINTRSTVNDQK